MYVNDASFSEETTSSKSITQFSDDEDGSSNSQETTEESSQHYGAYLADETTFLNEDRRDIMLTNSDPKKSEMVAETFDWKSRMSAHPTEEELDLEFLMELTPNPDNAHTLDIDAEHIRDHFFTPASVTRNSMIYAETGTKTAGSFVLSPRVVEGMKFSATF